jgi:predicted transcriptional regulator
VSTTLQDRLALVLQIAKQSPTTASAIERAMKVSRRSAQSYLDALLEASTVKRILVKTAKARKGECLYFVPGDEERAERIADEMRGQRGVGFGSALFEGRRKAG